MTDKEREDAEADRKRADVKQRLGNDIVSGSRGHCAALRCFTLL
jgi:hypothetical protein